MILETERLFLVHPPLGALKTRLERDDFWHDVPGVGSVRFPPGWPGEDALPILPGWAAWLEAHGPRLDQPGGTAVHKLERTAIGGVGFKGDPDERGHVEIGYGFNASHWGQGYATEAVGALCRWTLETGFARAVTAETLEGNAASKRVLEKLGFAPTGERFDAEEGGTLILWTLSG